MDGPSAVRMVDLRDGGRLVIRPMDPEDLPALTAFYEALPEDDRRCRFFTAQVPSVRFLEQWVHLPDEGGLGLVVVARDAGGHELIVGDAGYRLEPDGGGDFGIAVAPSHRGWLGPYLLDALVEAAAERGVPYLTADILLSNRPMIAVVRHRGYASIGYDEWHTVRVLVGTRERAPAWPGHHERQRLLVEAPGARWHAEQAARDEHLDVAVCPGPDPTGGRRCPAVQGRPCPLAAGADAIVVALRPDDPYAPGLVDAHTLLHADVPVGAEPPGTTTEDALREVLALLGASEPAGIPTAET